MKRPELIWLAIAPWLGAPLFAWTSGERYLDMVWAMYRGIVPFALGIATVLIWRWGRARFAAWRTRRYWRRRRRWEPVGDPTPRHWNCRCSIIPINAGQEEEDDK